MRVEAADLMDPRLICVATIAQVRIPITTETKEEDVVRFCSPPPPTRLSVVEFRRPVPLEEEIRVGRIIIWKWIALMDARRILLQQYEEHDQ